LHAFDIVVLGLGAWEQHAVLGRWSWTGRIRFRLARTTNQPDDDSDEGNEGGRAIRAVLSSAWAGGIEGAVAIEDVVAAVVVVVVVVDATVDVEDVEGGGAVKVGAVVGRIEGTVEALVAPMVVTVVAAVAAAIIVAVVFVVGEFAAMQLATGRLSQPHCTGFVVQF
jgi:hypothetical protein